MLPGKCFRVHKYTKCVIARNRREAANLCNNNEPELTRGGLVIKRCRPQWSASVCNLKAALAGIGQEVRHVG